MTVLNEICLELVNISICIDMEYICMNIYGVH